MAGLLVLPLAWYAIGCGDAGSGDPAADTERDLTSLNTDLGEEAVVSPIELGLTQPVQTDFAAGASPTSATHGPSADVEVENTVTAPALVSFVDGLEMGGEPTAITASLPIMGSGAGTLLQPGVTVAAVGEPMQLFQPVARGDSPWPEARTGEFPSVDRSGGGLVIGRVGGGGGGHCPMPGL